MIILLAQTDATTAIAASVAPASLVALHTTSVVRVKTVVLEPHVASATHFSTEVVTPVIVVFPHLKVAAHPVPLVVETQTYPAVRVPAASVPAAAVLVPAAAATVPAAQVGFASSAEVVSSKAAVQALIVVPLTFQCSVAAAFPGN